MKGLLIKELIQLKKGIIMYVIFLLVLLVISLCTGLSDGASWAVWCYFMAFAIAIMDSDVSSRFNRYNVTMPVSRSDIIRSKYLTVAIMELMGLLVLTVGTLLHILLAEVLRLEENTEILSVVYLVMAFMIFIIIEDTFALVCIFWKGARRGRWIAIPTEIILLIGFIIGFNYLERTQIFATLSLMKYFIPVLLTAIALRAVSLPLAIKLYEKRSL